MKKNNRIKRNKNENWKNWSQSMDDEHNKPKLTNPLIKNVNDVATKKSEREREKKNLTKSESDFFFILQIKNSLYLDLLWFEYHHHHHQNPWWWWRYSLIMATSRLLLLNKTKCSECRIFQLKTFKYMEYIFVLSIMKHARTLIPTLQWW